LPLGCGNLADRYLRTGAVDRPAAILPVAHESRVAGPASFDGPTDAPRGVVRETTHTDAAAESRRPTLRILRP